MADPEKDIAQLESLLRRLEKEYDQFLVGLLRREPAIGRCMVRNLFRYATAHVELPTEIVPLKALDARFGESNHRMKALVVELAASDAFRWAQAPVLETP